MTQRASLFVLHVREIDCSADTNEQSQSANNKKVGSVLPVGSKPDLQYLNTFDDEIDTQQIRDNL
jgi:hypothetical protein